MKLQLQVYKKNIFFILCIMILFGCSGRKEKNQVIVKSNKKDTAITFSIHNAGRLLFRRSYSNGDGAVSWKEIKRIEKSNPNPDYFNDSILMKKVHELNLVDKDGNLIRNKFKFNKTKDFELTTQNGQKIICQIVRPVNPDKYDKYNLSAVKSNQTTEIEIEGNYGMVNNDIKYLLFDIIPGGYKEIIILNEYYIMNGDNSDIFIYEINDER